ncbi:hypothetical protein A2442_03095 [Candidatus Campbellbacteria bacterium RIFOXYC2_FULL_35_25]|uniref:Uncharacterized protein n=1 Tax=Candidatus Campbellbacteria bacterium RIFOXYC2_FULL_35_25 TaxID=1797582 RepID=A0A1F5EJB9_9BACT|nr:MAG: hypothetical protein A2442_03095 [Candidatus Campbellbacteria bacterium RIFOXYC2_FULL_35_25]
MSTPRKIELSKDFSSKGCYKAKAEIFKDTGGMALSINIKNETTGNLVASDHFGIGSLNLNEERENWLANIIVSNMIRLAVAVRKETGNEIYTAYQNFITSISP